MPLGGCICYCSRGSVSLCGDPTAVAVNAGARCGRRAAGRGAPRGGSGWGCARPEPGLAISGSCAELWELVLRGEETGQG